MVLRVPLVYPEVRGSFLRARFTALPSIRECTYCITSDQNQTSKFEVQLLLRADHFPSIVELKNYKSNH